jgi:hypothetical protein
MRAGVKEIKYCFGITRLEEGLVQILSLKPQDGLKKVARIQAEGIELEELSCLIPFSAMETISVEAEFTARSRDVIDTNSLADKQVAFIGLGSVGSQLSLHLAQSALGSFTLLDPDRLSAANLSRHACGLTDLARFKTKAVRDLILNRNPQAVIQTFEDDFLSLTWPEQLERLADADLVIASTDSTPVQFMVNEVCHSLQIPSLYVGCYERACAGEVLFVIPGQTACFNCFMEFRQSYLADLKKKEERVPYSDETPSDFKGEPGLAIDIAYVVAVASAYALALLLPSSSRSQLLDLERNLALVHSGSVPQGRYGEIFQMPFDLLQARIKRDQLCLVCQERPSFTGEKYESPTDIG